jgi:type IV pilus assembly protein PilO
MNLNDLLNQFRSLDPNNPGSWPRGIQALAIVALCGLLVFLGYRFLITPKLQELAGARAQEQALRSEFETKQQKVAALDAYRAQLDEMQRSFGAMLKQLPNKSEVANLLNDVSQTRVASGLEENLFQPQGETNKEFYAELPINIGVTGSYHQLGSFVSTVAALPRIVTVGDVSISGGGATPPPAARPGAPKPSINVPTSRLSITMVAKTYRYLDEGQK